MAMATLAPTPIRRPEMNLATAAGRAGSKPSSFSTPRGTANTTDSAEYSYSIVRT